MLAEDSRHRARQIELADNATHHRILEQQQAHMTAFTGNFLQSLRDRPVALPEVLTPQLVTVNNISNVGPTMNVLENIQNVFQSTHNVHHNTLNFMSNTANRVLNYFGPSTPGGQPELLPVMNGGSPPPPPPAAGAARIAIRDGSATPAPATIALPDGAPPTPPTPLAIEDRRPQKKVLKKPKLKPKIRPDPIPLPPPPPMLIDEPQRKKPRKSGKSEEILRILSDMTSSEPRRAKQAIANVPPTSRLRLRAA